MVLSLVRARVEGPPLLLVGAEAYERTTGKPMPGAPLGSALLQLTAVFILAAIYNTVL